MLALAFLVLIGLMVSGGLAHLTYICQRLGRSRPAARLRLRRRRSLADEAHRWLKGQEPRR